MDHHTAQGYRLTHRRRRVLNLIRWRLLSTEKIKVVVRCSPHSNFRLSTFILRIFLILLFIKHSLLFQAPPIKFHCLFILIRILIRKLIFLMVRGKIMVLILAFLVGRLWNIIYFIFRGLDKRIIDGLPPNGFVSFDAFGRFGKHIIFSMLTKMHFIAMILSEIFLKMLSVRIGIQCFDLMFKRLFECLLISERFENILLLERINI